MNEESFSDIAKYIFIMVIVCGCLWMAGKLFADSVSDYKLIKPKNGVECVVVSRMFNTSVDCWVSLEGLNASNE